MNGKHGQGTHFTKMGADKSAENTPNAPKFICPNCLPKPKSLGVSKKSSLWVSVVRGLAFCIKSVQSVKLSSPHSALVHISFYNEVN